MYGDNSIQRSRATGDKRRRLPTDRRAAEGRDPRSSSGITASFQASTDAVEEDVEAGGSRSGPCFSDDTSGSPPRVVQDDVPSVDGPSCVREVLQCPDCGHRPRDCARRGKLREIDPGQRTAGGASAAGSGRTADASDVLTYDTVGDLVDALRQRGVTHEELDDALAAHGVRIEQWLNKLCTADACTCGIVKPDFGEPATEGELAKSGHKREAMVSAAHKFMKRMQRINWAITPAIHVEGKNMHTPNGK